MVEGDDEEEKETLQREIRQLSERVAELEEALHRATAPISDLLGRLDNMQKLAGNYFKLLELYQRKGTISPEAVLPELRNPIAIEIVKVLFDQGGLNVSEITERLRERRGSASRTVVRERLQQLAEDGIVELEEGPGGVGIYSISESVADRWYRLLGIRR